jgi:hypothetical protein
LGETTLQEWICIRQAPRLPTAFRLRLSGFFFTEQAAPPGTFASLQ